MHILVVGSLNMDLVVRLPELPRPGETRLGGTFATFPGGKGANQAVAAARLGARVTLIGRVGQDAFGRQLLDSLAAEGIDQTHVSLDPVQPTGVALIQVDARGENTIAVASGANFALSEAHLRDAWSRIEPPDWLVMPLEMPIETVEAAARLAEAAGVGVILNPAPARPLPAELLRRVDVLVPNQHEAAILAGRSGSSDQDIRNAAADLRTQGASGVIVTLGERGALILDRHASAPVIVPAYPVEAIDTTAAGDCFVGALAVALAEQRSLPDAAAFASAAAALSVTHSGAQPSMPTRQELASFLAHLPPPT